MKRGGKGLEMDGQGQFTIVLLSKSKPGRSVSCRAS